MARRRRRQRRPPNNNADQGDDDVIGKDMIDDADCDGCLKKKLCYLIKFDNDAGENQFCVKCFDKQAQIKHRARKSRRPTQQTIQMATAQAAK